MMGQAMDTDQADWAALQAHASGGHLPSVGGAGSEGGGGGQEGDTKMAGRRETQRWLDGWQEGDTKMAGGAGGRHQDGWQLWQLQREIPHLARLLEAAGLTQSARCLGCEPLTRAATTAMSEGEIKWDQRRPNRCEYLAKELMSPSEAAVHKAAWPKGQKSWMAVNQGKK